MLKKIFLFATFSVFFLLLGQGVFAQEKSWYFERFDVDITINQDASFIVRETHTYKFTGNFHWVKRDIAKQKLRKITDVKVFDETDRQLQGNEVEIDGSGSQVSVKLNFDLTDTEKTWIFEYKVLGGLGFYDNWDELYWNAVSIERDVIILRSEVVVHLPEGVDKSKLKQRMFIGQVGSKDESPNFEIVDGKTLRYWAYNIEPYHAMTIVAGWPKGIVSPPFVDTQAFKILIVILAILLPILVFILMFYLWWTRGRDVGGRKTIVPQYEPPSGPEAPPGRRPENPLGPRRSYILPAEMGVLIDEKINMKDISATIIDLAYRGYLQIVVIEKEVKTWFLKNVIKDYTLKLLKPIEGLTEFETLLLQGLFEGGTEIKLSDLRNKFYKKLPDLKNALYKRVVKLKYFKKSPEKVRALYFLIAMSFIVFGIFGSLFLTGLFVQNAVLLFIFGLVMINIFICGVIVLLFSFRMPKKTPTGVLAKEWADGFKMYLHTAERFRLQDLTPETFEKYLSYAIIFGVEGSWAERFADIYVDRQPNWYLGAPGQSFNSFDLAKGLVLMSSSAESSMAPPSSNGGGSGFGGGGGAGGGGGGGGSSAG